MAGLNSTTPSLTRPRCQGNQSRGNPYNSVNSQHIGSVQPFPRYHDLHLSNRVLHGTCKRIFDRPSSSKVDIKRHHLQVPIPGLPFHLLKELEHIRAPERTDSVLSDAAVALVVWLKDIAAAITLGLCA